MTIQNTLIVTCLGHVIVQCNTAILNLAIYRIQIEFGADVSSLQWIVNAYMLAFAALLLSGGTLCDRLGLRPTFLWGVGIFAFGSFGTAAGTTIASLVVSQALAGMASALIIPCSLALIARECDGNPRLRARSIAVWTAVGGAAVALNPVVGGYLMTIAGWRNAFAAEGILCLATALFALRYIRATPRNAKARFDLVGQTFVALTLLGFIAAAIEAGRRGLTEPLVVGFLLLAVTAGVSALIMGRRRGESVLPLDLFGRAGFTAAIAVSCVTNITYYGVVFVLSLYFQRQHDYSPAETGLAFLPFSFAFVLASIGGGWLGSVFGPRLPLIAGLTVACIGYFVLYFYMSESLVDPSIVAFLLIPVGMAGLIAPAATDILLGSVALDRAGTAGAFLNTAKQGTGAIGVAVYGIVATGGPDLLFYGLKLSFLTSAILFFLALAAFQVCMGRTARW
nr:MFS transporter [Rhizobium sp. 007]